MQRAINLHVNAAGTNGVMTVAPRYAHLKLPILTMAERRVLSSNSAAQEELERGRLIRCVGGRLYCRDPVFDRMLVSMTLEGEAHQKSVLTTALDGNRFLAQAVRFNLLRGTLMEAAGADDPAVVLILTALEDGAAGRENALKALKCFTPVEHAIAMALVNGQSIDDISKERRTSVQTIRWHLRNMSEKTGENGVKGLTRLLTLLLPI